MYKFIFDKIKKKVQDHLRSLFSSAIDNNPNDSSAYNNRAILEIEEGDIEASLQDMNHAIALNSKYHHLIHYQCSAAYCFRAYTHIFQKNIEKAKQDLTQAIFQDHNNNDAIKAQKVLNNKYYSIGSFNWIFKNKPKISYLDKLVTEFDYAKIEMPADVLNSERNVWYKKAIDSYNAGKFLDTIANLKNFIKQNPENKNALCDMALAHIMAAQYDSAAKYYRKCLKLDREYSNAYFGLGVALFFKREFKKAESSLNTAIELMLKEHHEYHTNSSIQFYNRAFIHYLSGNYDMCIDDIEKSLELYHKNKDSLILRAKVYLKKRKPRDALADIHHVLQIEKDNPEALAMKEELEELTCK